MILDSWKSKIKEAEKSPSNYSFYTEALNACVKDIENLIDRTHREEAQALESENSYFDSLTEEELEEMYEDRRADDALNEEYNDHYYN